MPNIDELVHLPRRVKRLLLMISDGGLLLLSVWLAFSLRLGEFYMPVNQGLAALLLAVPVIGVIIFERFGLYRMVTRYINSAGNRRIIYAISMTVLCWGMVVALARVPGDFPRSAYILLWLIGIILVIGSRSLIASMLLRTGMASPTGMLAECQRVVIYGAGSAGHLLAGELSASGTHLPIAFLDDDSSLWGQKVGSLKVRRPAKIEDLIAQNDVREILLALPSATHKRRREILKSLEPLPVLVKTVPSITEIASGSVTIADVRPISVNDLLGRDPVPPNETLLAQDIAGKCVLITGAGGSIGSELARQVLALGPAKLVLLELSEIALYDIEMEIRELDETLLARSQVAESDEQSGSAVASAQIVNPIPSREPCQIIAVLGSVLDPKAMRDVIKRHRIRTIYHAAAYKHVPIVELNPVAGLNNNTFGTLNVVQAARELGVSRFVLISTDKAVRPTNIMGASKRLAELVLQAHAANKGDTNTIFTMVRFGNVLASSGSVVQRFTKQIEAGGPVTVTHRNIIRYFMSIPEAAQLVIQAGAMAGGGDVFVLDMGEPVKIDALARMMISLAGLQVDAQSTGGASGDIAIAYTGLRPGEKLFEELLIGDNTVDTDHPRIMRSNEPKIEMDELERELASLQAAMQIYDIEAIHDHLVRLVEGYQPDKAHLPTPELEKI